MKTLIALLLSVSMVVSTGCGSWLSNFEKDPVAQTNSILGTIETIISVATLIFGDAKPLLPVDQQAKAQADFNVLILNANRVKQEAQDLLVIAKDTSNEHPDLSKVVTDSVKAVQDLKVFLAGLQASVGRQGVTHDQDDIFDRATVAIKKSM